MPDDEGGAGGAADEFKPISSQEELDRRIGERLHKERQKYADYDDLKAKAAKFDEADAATKTELQKLQDAVAERDQKLAALPTEVRKQAIRFASLASQKGFLDPEDALVFIDVDLSDEAAVKAALDDLAERKPHLVRTDGNGTKPKVPTRPKPAEGAAGSGDGSEDLTGKERAAAALRQIRST